VCDNRSNSPSDSAQAGQPMTIDELEREYTPLKAKVKDLREYL
jgi:hypothetical protein